MMAAIYIQVFQQTLKIKPWSANCRSRFWS